MLVILAVAVVLLMLLGILLIVVLSRSSSTSSAESFYPPSTTIKTSTVADTETSLVPVVIADGSDHNATTSAVEDVRHRATTASSEHDHEDMALTRPGLPADDERRHARTDTTTDAHDSAAAASSDRPASAERLVATSTEAAEHHDDQSSHDLHIAPDVLLPPLPRHADDDEQAKPSSSSPAATSSTQTVASSPATTTHEAVAEQDEQMDDIQVIAADDETAEDCKEFRNHGRSRNGVYSLAVPGVGKLSVVCDHSTDGGGWTIFQRRVDGAISFWNRTWSEYVDGFGDVHTSYWLGLERLHALTAKDAKRNRKGVVHDWREYGDALFQVVLRIDLYGDFCAIADQCSGMPNGYWFGEWYFKVAGASENYALTLSPAFAGNISEHNEFDVFYYMNNGQPFSTIDRDNDKDRKINCAQFRDIGGWWHRDCTQVALNGRYGDTMPKMRHMFWLYKSGAAVQKNYYIHPRRSEMKLRVE